MKIEVKNEINGNSVRFLGIDEWNSLYKPYCGIEQPATDDNNYQLKTDNLTGWFSLPVNNTNSQQGLNQDGTDKLNNYYGDRNVTWSFRWVGLQNMEYLARTLFQDDYLLTVELTIADRTYVTYGTINGRYEGGVIDMDVRPFFDVKGADSKKEFILTTQDGLTPFLPLKMPEVFIDDGVNRIDTVVLDVGYSVSPVITVEGNITGVRIEYDSGFIETSVPGAKYVFDNRLNVVTVDGKILSPNDVKGNYMTLHSGENVLKFSFEQRQGDVKVTTEYVPTSLVAW